MCENPACHSKTGVAPTFLLLQTWNRSGPAVYIENGENQVSKYHEKHPHGQQQRFLAPGTCRVV